MPRLLLFSVVVSVITLIAIYPDRVGKALEVYCDWMETKAALGTFVMVVVLIIATSLGTPGSLMSIGTGFIFYTVYKGLVWKSILVGLLVVFLGTWLGSILAFLLGRYVLQDLTRRLNAKYKTMRALDLAIQNEGLRICILLRLCPLVPFNAFNYLMGGTSISLKNYVLGGFATIPIVTINVFVGTTIGSIKEAVRGDYDGGLLNIVLISVGALLSILLIVYIGALIKRYLKRFAQMTSVE